MVEFPQVIRNIKYWLRLYPYHHNANHLLKLKFHSFSGSSLSTTDQQRTTNEQNLANTTLGMNTPVATNSRKILSYVYSL